MGTHEADKFNVSKEYLSGLYQENEHELQDEELFSCAGCIMRPTCTGHVSHTMITRLINSWDYNLDYVVIIHYNPILFQLKVIHLDKLLMDEYHANLATAKDSFLLTFSHHSNANDFNPKWISFYPCSDWLDEINIPEKPMEKSH